MNNLPTDNNQVNYVNTPSVDPHFVGGPEGSLETTPSAETTTPPEELFSLENLKSTETPKVQEAPTPADRTSPQTPTNSASATQNVVDKTEKITHLHRIAETDDKLTAAADEEEEHFIEEVEKHHGDL